MSKEKLYNLTITLIYAIMTSMEVIVCLLEKIKTGVLVNMDKELKSKLEQLAKKDGRSLTNLINKILSDYVEDTQK